MRFTYICAVILSQDNWPLIVNFKACILNETKVVHYWQMQTNFAKANLQNNCFDYYNGTCHIMKDVGTVWLLNINWLFYYFLFLMITMILYYITDPAVCLQDIAETIFFCGQFMHIFGANKQFAIIRVVKVRKYFIFRQNQTS